MLLSPMGSIAAGGRDDLELEAGLPREGDLLDAARLSPPLHNHNGGLRRLVSESDILRRAARRSSEADAPPAIDAGHHRNGFWLAYLKRRRTMHTEAHELYSLAANLLALSAVLLSALAAALSILLREVAAGPYAVAALACVSAVLIGVQQKLKVDAKAEAHHISAHRFDQLVTEAVGRSVARGIHARDVAAWEKEISLMPKTPLPRRIRVRHLAGESHCSGTAVRSAADKRATSLAALSRTHVRSAPSRVAPAPPHAPPAEPSRLQPLERVRLDGGPPALQPRGQHQRLELARQLHQLQQLQQQRRPSAVGVAIGRPARRPPSRLPPKRVAT